MTGHKEGAPEDSGYKRPLKSLKEIRGTKQKEILGTSKEEVGTTWLPCIVQMGSSGLLTSGPTLQPLTQFVKLYFQL